uniref:Kappa-stichotoxin-Shd5a n=1 Tax=Stichodactyla haddoni TaxID=475174 RepID=K1A_STIHA|nr:RecName: Full=Kappa-stichotoxin-Shd5a; Short=Kappa-SHTX-Shd5a; AltName: Full=Kappa1.3-stichotoxin-Sha1a; Short=Kappa1.3-SHTX-Sha1a; AltName: Full=Potassium channel peptide toxin shtx-k; AltName: Full=ShaK; Flags: Precursor [Stichodactyla haddoni]BAJ23159.1 potassium channel peptide toxin [Stichodactyla haddoni]
MKFQVIAAVLLIAFCLCVVVTARMELQDVEDVENGFQKRRSCIDTIPQSRCTAFQCKHSMKYRLSFCRKTCGTC